MDGYEEELDETVLPDEDDTFLSDVVRGGYNVTIAGRYHGWYLSRRRAEAAIYLAHTKDGFHPNIWHVNDHGNTDLMTWTEGGHLLTPTGVGWV